ncbi:MAG: ABC transporter substrate-binding protein [Methanomassiliicoccales archaeon]|nr:ABC transporter substrate-binding protein [Methanomassiliicoccales archaeon]MDD1756816.1 ABC transporter substrate-binding protein [Methanomassiliicoccales archaeon]
MEKRTAWIAVAVVAIVVVAAVAAYIYWPPPPEEKGTIYWIGIPPKDQQASFVSGAIDGAVSWEPYCSDSIVAGDAHVLLWSGEIWPNHPCCVVAVKTDFLESNPDLVARMVRAHIDADLWIIDALEHPESANYTLLLQMGATFSARSTEVVEAALEHIKYSFELTPEVLDGFADFTEMFIDLNQTSLGSYDSIDDFVTDFVNDTMITAALSVQPSDEVLGTIDLGFLAGDLHQFARVVAMNSTVGGGKTLYETYGLNVVAANPAGYLNGGAVMDAFAGGAIDVGYLGAPPAILKKLNVGTDIKVVALANSEGSAILAREGINSFAELENHTVATPGPSSIQHLLLLFYAEQQGFQMKLEGT